MKRVILLLVIVCANFCLAIAQDIPIVSSKDNSNETWYTIRFVNGSNGVVEDMGEGLPLRNCLPNGRSSQLWKVTQGCNSEGIPVAGEFVLIGKSGRMIYFDGANYVASALLSVNVVLDRQYDGFYQKDLTVIKRVGGQAIHQPNGGILDQDLLEFGDHEWANVLIFGPALPEVSSTNKEVWYFMQFNPGIAFDNKVVTYAGNDKNLLQSPYVQGNNDQLWKVVATDVESRFVVENKSGARLVFNEKYQASKTVDATLLEFNVSVFGMEWWALKRVGVSGDRYWMNTLWVDNIPTEVGEWDQHGGGSALRFVYVSENIMTPTDIDHHLSSQEFKPYVQGNVILINGSDFRYTLFSAEGKIVDSGIDKQRIVAGKGVYILLVEYAGGEFCRTKIVIQ